MKHTFMKFKEAFALPLRNGLTKPSKVRGNGIPMVNMKEIFAYNKIYDDTPMELVPVTDKEFENTSLEFGDLLFARQSLTEEGAGKVCIYKGHQAKVFESHLIRCRLDQSKFDSDYFYYFFSSSIGKALVSTIVQQTAAAGIRGSDLQELEIPTPSLPEQKAIASVLSSLDDKIDLLNHQNKTLEAMAETLFRQWFIEDESANRVAISELIDVNPKRTLAKCTESTYLEMAGLSTQSFNATGYYTRVFTSGTKFINQDTLLARITPCLENGKAGYVTFLSDNEVGWGSTEYIVMRPKSGIHPLMAYVLCRNQDFKDYAESCMEGSSGRQRVNVDHLKEFTISKPSDEVIQQFNDYLESIESKLIYNSKQIQTLEQLRDTLLPKLMSGEVRVQYQTQEVA